MNKTHILKTLQPFFQLLLDGKKKWEMRLNDRDFQVGDILYLKEITLKPLKYTGRELQARVLYVFHVKTLFKLVNVVVMSIEVIEDSNLD